MLAHLEEALGDRAARVHDALRNTLAVKLRDLLQQVVVLQQNGAALTSCSDREESVGRGRFRLHLFAKLHARLHAKRLFATVAALGGGAADKRMLVDGLGSRHCLGSGARG
eukprot:3564-Chlamydomonas_euryale.AAC.3